MRVSFSNTNLAGIAVGVLEAYGYSATQIGTSVLTDCPTLLAVPAIAKHVGLAEIEGVDVSGTRALDCDTAESSGASISSLADRTVSTAGHIAAA
jgi:hypothetical protein